MSDSHPFGFTVYAEMVARPGAVKLTSIVVPGCEPVMVPLVTIHPCLFPDDVGTVYLIPVAALKQTVSGPVIESGARVFTTLMVYTILVIFAGHPLSVPLTLNWYGTVWPCSHDGVQQN